MAGDISLINRRRFDFFDRISKESDCQRGERMNQSFRAAGFTYLRYVNTCSVSREAFENGSFSDGSHWQTMVRRCIKDSSELKKDSLTRDAANVIVFKVRFSSFFFLSFFFFCLFFFSLPFLLASARLDLDSRVCSGLMARPETASRPRLKRQRRRASDRGLDTAYQINGALSNVSIVYHQRAVLCARASVFPVWKLLSAMA